MKIIIGISVILLLITGCKDKGVENNDAFARAVSSTNTSKEDIEVSKEDYKLYGETFEISEILTSTEVGERYASLKGGDTTQVTFKAPINAVCASKGCWMRLDLPEEKEVFVKFKDYGFFVPTETNGGDAIVNGKAYLEEVSIDELKHMAEDGGESPEEIAAITESKRELRFMADGVMIKGK